MHTWTFKDGTILRSGGKVEGDSKLAKTIRDELQYGAEVDLLQEVAVDPGERVSSQ